MVSVIHSKHDDHCHHFPSGVPWDAHVEGFNLATPHIACMIPI